TRSGWHPEGGGAPGARHLGPSRPGVVEGFSGPALLADPTACRGGSGPSAHRVGGRGARTCPARRPGRRRGEPVEACGFLAARSPRPAARRARLAESGRDGRRLRRQHPAEPPPTSDTSLPPVSQADTVPAMSGSLTLSYDDHVEES